MSALWKWVPFRELSTAEPRSAFTSMRCKDQSPRAERASATARPMPETLVC